MEQNAILTQTWLHLVLWRECNVKGLNALNSQVCTSGANLLGLFTKNEQESSSCSGFNLIHHDYFLIAIC